MLQIPDSFEAPSYMPLIDDEAAKKRLFGIELAKNVDAFAAASNIFKDQLNLALWASQHWINDPVVLANKDAYDKTTKNEASLLDKDELAGKLLEMAEEKNANGLFYILEGKDRLKALELYAEIRGYTGKASVDLSTKNFTYNKMVVKLVEPETKVKVIEQNNNLNEENSTIPSPIKLKLVS